MRAPRQRALELIAPLTQGADKFDREPRARLLRYLGQAYVAFGDLPRATELFLKAAELEPNDLTSRAFLLDLAVAGKNDDLARRAVEEIEKIDGTDGPTAILSRAVVRLPKTKASDAPALAAIRGELEVAESKRPSWSKIHVAFGQLAERVGDTNTAIARYTKAVHTGERNPDIIRRLVELLHQARMPREAAELLATLRAQGALDKPMEFLASQMALQSAGSAAERDDAARRAVAYIDPKSADYRDQLWRGQMYATLRETKQAEAAFRRAVELNAKAPDAWIMLVGFYQSNNNPRLAEEAVAQIGRNLDPEQLDLTLAVCHDLLGKNPEAEKYFQQALAKKPDDPNVLRSLIGFYQRTGAVGRAEEYLDKFLKGKPSDADAVWARRALALSMVARSGGAPAKVRDALRLIDQNLNRRSPATEDQRARALILSTQPDQRDEAIRLLEESFSKQGATPAEQFTLARLYDQQGRWDQVYAIMVQSLAQSRDPNHFAFLIRGLLKRDETLKARDWLDRLKKIDAESWTFAEVEALYLARTGDKRRAVERLKAKPRPKGEEFTRALAELFDQMDCVPEAEEAFREYVRESKAPDAHVALALFFAKRDRLDDSLDTLEKHADGWEVDRAAGAMVSLLRVGRTVPTTGQLRRVDRWLGQAIEKHPKVNGLRLSLAELRDLEQKYPESVQIFRDALKVSPDDVVAINNLALTLALQKAKGPEPEQLIDQAIKLQGRTAVLLDTRAVVLMNAGRYQEAVQELKEAIGQQPKAIYYFHLAQAHTGAKNPAAAADAVKKAVSLGISQAHVHPLEGAGYRQLIEPFGR
jgi:tetratricopeptide (TPR) repeat protein